MKKMIPLLLALILAALAVFKFLKIFSKNTPTKHKNFSIYIEGLYFVFSKIVD